jgi:dTDP-4-dehydrorhamnose 3,5-epimerase
MSIVAAPKPVSGALRFHATPIAGCFVVDPVRRGDDRGFFARAFCQAEFEAAGIEGSFVQANNSLTHKPFTLRGMHYQLPPAAEVKLVRCLAGALFDVVADLRPDSPSHGQWFGAMLTAENRQMMVVPRGCAHGFLTMEPDTEAFYMVSAAYAPDRERGLRWDDAFLGIEWPRAPAELSAKDSAWPDYDPEFHGAEQLRGLV